MLGFRFGSSINQVIQRIEVRDWERKAKGSSARVACLGSGFNLGARLNQCLGYGERSTSADGSIRGVMPLLSAALGFALAARRSLVFLEVVDGRV